MGYVAIQTIIAEGTKWNDASCVKCRPGYHQPYTNSTNCLECPRNSYQAAEGRFEYVTLVPILPHRKVD